MNTRPVDLESGRIDSRSLRENTDLSETSENTSLTTSTPLERVSNGPPPLISTALPSTSITVKRDGKSVRYCRKCRCVKPDRAHHCRICQEYVLFFFSKTRTNFLFRRCVLKMDQ